ncbi:hypothetical protein GW17_00049875 [Ensete ventricosum]|nr:hypothetical protein GW17_00049875 [Ensete ventricosum]
MANGGLTVVDGSTLRADDLRLPLPDGAVSGARLLQHAESEAAARLFGLSLPDPLRSAAFRRVAGGDARSFEEEVIDADSARRKVREYLLALADDLADDPLAISVLDGSALRVFLDDEDDFAMLAENLFTDLDVDDRGKLSKREIQDALVLMGVEMGVPTFSGWSFNQSMLNICVYLQLLEHKELLHDEMDSMFGDWNAHGHGEGNMERLQGLLKAKGSKLGLPAAESNEAVALLYDQIFSEIKEEVIAGELTRDAFHVVVSDIMEKLVDQLEANPIFTDTGS